MPRRFTRREALTEDEQKRVEGDRTDFAWLAEHAQEIEARYRGKYIAVVNSTLFVGESYEEVWEKARAACPDKEPFVEQVTVKRRISGFSCLHPESLRWLHEAAARAGTDRLTMEEIDAQIAAHRKGL